MRSGRTTRPSGSRTDLQEAPDSMASAIGRSAAVGSSMRQGGVSAGSDAIFPPWRSRKVTSPPKSAVSLAQSAEKEPSV